MSRPTDPINEGQRLLRECGRTLTEIAALTGAKKQSVSFWRRGLQVPGEEYRRAMEAAYGIPAIAWDQPPSTGPVGAPLPVAPRTTEAPRPAPPPVAPQTTEAPRPAPPPVVIPRTAGVTTLDEVTSLLESLRSQRQRDDLLPAAIVRLTDSETKLLALKARLEEKQEMLEDRIVREHPFWMRLRGAILAALQPYPDAARAVIAALEEMEA